MHIRWLHLDLVPVGVVKYNQGNSQHLASTTDHVRSKFRALS